MDAISTSLDGLFKIRLRRACDERGWFIRTFDAERFAELGFVTSWPQRGEAYNAVVGTLRGLHFQLEPHAEVKLIRCTRGGVYDVLVDVRDDSPTYGRWEAFTLEEDDGCALYAPAGFAHGYQTLRDGATLEYLHSAPYSAAAASGYRYDSPELAIPWPLVPTVISTRDAALPAFSRAAKV